MSHEISYFQGLNDDQLFYEMLHANFSIDRARAKEVYQQRIRDRAEAEAQRSNRRLTNLQNNVNGLQTRINTLTHQNTQLANEIRQQNTQLQAAQNAHREAVAKLRRDYDRRFNEVNQENKRALEEMERQHHKDIHQVQNTIAQNFQRTTTMIKEVNHNLNQVKEEVERQIDQTNARVDILQAQFEKLHIGAQALRKNAQEYEEAAVAVINATIEFNEENGHDWRSEELGDLLDIRNKIEMNMNDPLTVGTARNEAYNFFRGALKYRAHVHADENEWQMRRALAQQSVDTSMNECDNLSTIETEDYDDNGELGPVTLDVDYWTYGERSRIKEKLEELQSLLNTPTMDFDGLERVAQLAETYRKELEEIRMFAIRAYFNSRDRKELLEEARLITVERLGATSQWEYFYDLDDRRDYRIFMKAPTGEEIVLTAEPAERNGQITNRFEIELLEAGGQIRNQADFERLIRELVDDLNQLEDVRFGVPTCNNPGAPVANHGQGDQTNWTAPAPAAANNRPQIKPQLVQHQAPVRTPAVQQRKPLST